MKTFNAIINQIIIPFGTLAFFMVGMSSAAISALVEFCVFRDFFTSSYQNLIPSAGIALLLVCCLEYSKFYLHFLNEKIKSSNTDKDIQKKFSKLPYLINLLIAISVICTIIFTVTTLYLPTYDKESILNQITELDENLELDKARINSHYDEIYEEQLKPYLDAKTKAEDAQKNFSPVGYGPKALESIYTNLQKNVDFATQNYHEAVQTYKAERDRNISNQYKLLEDHASAEKSNLLDTNTPEVAAQYDNPILSSFLTVLALIFFRTSYSRISYLLVCVSLGIALAIILEVLIATSSRFISVNMDFLVQKNDELSEKIHLYCSKFVANLFKTFCAVMVYIVILTYRGATLEKDQIYLGLMSCMAAIYLSGKFISVPHDAEKHNKIYLYYQIRDCIVQGIVSLMGFILLGFVFGNDALNLDINMAAVGIGASISGGLGKMPSFLNNIGSTKESM